MGRYRIILFFCCLYHINNLSCAMISGDRLQHNCLKYLLTVFFSFSSLSNLSCLASEVTSLRRSSLNVQQIHPLLISIIFSSFCWTCAWTNEPSMFNSLISLTITAYRLPLWSLLNMCCSRVVFPAPRKPERTVTGSFFNFGTITLLSPVSDVATFRESSCLFCKILDLLHVLKMLENDLISPSNNKPKAMKLKIRPTERVARVIFYTSQGEKSWYRDLGELKRL